MREGSHVYMCLHDVQKVFNSVDYPVLLEWLFDVGVSSKIWRLLRSWYKVLYGCVRIDGSSSAEFPIERGVSSLSFINYGSIAFLGAPGGVMAAAPHIQ